MSDRAPGQRIGPYELVCLVGEGGMGEVWKARDTRLERMVAVKFSSDTFSDRFASEARTIASLNHSHVCQLYDVGPDYLVMELIEGRPVSNPLPLDKALRYGAEICDALDAAHRKGITHRDLKPDNILLSNSGVKLLDFGLAKRATVSAAAAGETVTMAHTEEHQIVGTLQYMSPEQLQGQSVDTRSDIFSFGVVLYELITGRHAFEGQSQASIIGAILKDEPPSMSSLVPLTPPALERAVTKCLAKDPERRWQSAADLRDELRWIAELLSEPQPSPATPSRWNWAYVALALVLGLAAGAGAGAWLLRPDAPAAPIPRYVTHSGRDSSPAISPDGKLIAFTSNRDGTSRIWLKQLSAGSEVAITSGTDEFPRFSPDGSEILFSRNDGTQTSLYRAPTLGGDPRRIVDDVANGDFSPNGRQVAFVRWKKSQSTAIGIANANGSDAREIVDVEGARLECPRWSPDGTQIALIASRQTNARGRVFVTSADGKSKGFLNETEGIGISSVAWVSNEEIIYLKGDQTAGESATLIRRNLRSGTTRSSPWPRQSQEIDISRSGRLLFDTQSNRSNLRAFSIAQNQIGVPLRWLTRGNNSDRQPVYSPDGKLVLFSSGRSGNMDIWRMSIDTGALTRVTDDPAIDFDPAFTRDGKGVIWSSNRGGNFEIYVAEADGSGAKQITRDGGDAENGTMTADSQWIVYVSAHPAKLGIWKVRPDGSAATRIVAGDYYNAEVSPDGRYVSYVTSVSGEKSVIRIARIADAAPVPFEIVCDIRKRTAWTIGRSRWMPDGRRIVFLGQDDRGLNTVYVQDFVIGKNTSASRRPLTPSDPEFDVETFAISPDGKHMIVSGWDQVASIMMADDLPRIFPDLTIRR